MNFQKMYDGLYGTTGVSGFFAAQGSFPIADGASRDILRIKEEGNTLLADYNDFSVKAVFKEYENGVFERQDYFTAKEDVTLTGYNSRFFLEGGEYEVYTQYSSWQIESLGGWQDLVTGVEVSNAGVRTTEGGAPMIALKNKANGKITVFHLVANAAWKIVAKRVSVNGKNNAVLVEIGLNTKALYFKCEKGEVITMPKIFCFEAEREIDLDAWKLHKVYNELYPRKEMPIVYNTWMLNFDTIDIDDIFRQIDTAAELGIENFLVDAGWFGNSENWGNEIGVWTENQKGGFKGRLLEVSDYVRNRGMKFGLWIEPERALEGIDAIKEHPEYYLEGTFAIKFFDFANPEACDYMFNLISGLIEKYHIDYMKFDFNATLAYDEKGYAFYKYFEGQKALVKRLKEKYPTLYLTNCASGGYRMEMGQLTYFDSVWISDNQSPIDALRIYKDTAKRLPPCTMEKYDVRTYCGGFPRYSSKEKYNMPISCHGATWETVVTVNESYTHNFITGGIMGFSGNIADYPKEEKEALKKLISDYKKDREFYKNAVMRILYDGNGITVLQYSDCDNKRVIIQAFTEIIYQDRFTVFPVLDASKNYVIEGKEFTGEQLLKDGIEIRMGDVSSVTLEYIIK